MAPSSTSPRSLGRSLAAILTLAVAIMEDGSKAMDCLSKDVVQVFVW